MKAIVESKNEQGESQVRVPMELATVEAAQMAAMNALAAQPDTVRVIVYQDLRPEGSDIPDHHDPRFFTVRVDMQRNPESGEAELVSSSWSE